jgi:hypothetical protein
MGKCARQHFLNQQDGEQASKLPSGQDHPGERGGLLDGCKGAFQFGGKHKI